MANDDSVHRAHRPATPLTGAFVLCLLFAGSGCRTTTTLQTPLSEGAVRLDLPSSVGTRLRLRPGLDLGLVPVLNIEIPAEDRVTLARTAAEHAGLSGGESHCLGAARPEIYLFQGGLDRSELASTDMSTPAGRRW